MGQYWAIVNADSKQTTGWIGKLGEFFHDGTSLLALLALAIPPLPECHFPVCGTWAGDRIICFGDNGDDFPEGFLLDSDKKTFPSSFTKSCTEVTLPQYSPSSKDVWVLRNLSKREYVRSNGIPDHDADGVLAYKQDIGLDGNPGLSRVLLSRICWSSDPSCSMHEGPLQLHRGPWAGDRFDVRVLDDVIESMKDEGKWVDVTRIAAREIYDLCKRDGYYDCEQDFEEEPRESDED